MREVRGRIEASHEAMRSATTKGEDGDKASRGGVVTQWRGEGVDAYGCWVVRVRVRV